MGASSRPIADYALLSDCHSSALVSRDASIDWACFRRFDRPSTFAHLLDSAKGGEFSVTPREPVLSRNRRYLPGTMVLETELGTGDGTLSVVDALAMRRGGARDPRGQLVRKLTAIAGSIDVEVVVAPRFDYGSSSPWLRSSSSRQAIAVAGDDGFVFDSDTDLVLDHERGAIVASVRLAAGESCEFVLTSRPAHLIGPSTERLPDADRLLDETVAWWTRWSEGTVAEGPYREQLIRSALVLKSLCCAPTGGIVAAPTTSLPEIPGGSANWDYRYCWVRDASLTLQALADVGHHEVAQGFRDFIMRSAAGRGDDLRIMYGVYGERRLSEFEVDLAGWRNSKPVRIGNAAAEQTQLDVYGHLLDAAHLWHRRTGGIDDDEWRFLSAVVDEARALRHRPDAGIWELRGDPQHHVHSKVMIWVALDRGIRLVDDHGLTEAHTEIDEWRRARDEIRDEIDSRGVHHGHYVSTYGSKDVDASLLKLALVGYVPADDARMVATVETITRDLADPSGMVRRFRGDGGMRTFGDHTEGVFLLCSFWLVEVLAMQGRHDEARALFERVLTVGNDVGLFAEEADPASGELLGNFPQAFTHLGLISAAMRLASSTGGS